MTKLSYSVALSLSYAPAAQRTYGPNTRIIRFEMDKTVAGEENIYFEMESKEASDTGIYDDVAGGSSDSPIKQTTIEKQGAENATQHSTEPGSFYQSDAVMVQRLLYAIIALVAISFLTAAATLVLALTIMSQSAPPQCKVSLLKSSDLL